jgi:hypothetical protein
MLDAGFASLSMQLAACIQQETAWMLDDGRLTGSVHTLDQFSVLA